MPTQRLPSIEPDGVASEISLVVADVDGTLVTADKVLTPCAAAAVAALHAAGIAFAITSGRPPRGIAMLIGPLALETPLAGFNGGIFVEPDMTVIEEHVLAFDVARRAVPSSTAVATSPSWSREETSVTLSPAPGPETGRYGLRAFNLWAGFTGLPTGRPRRKNDVPQGSRARHDQETTDAREERVAGKDGPAVAFRGDRHGRVGEREVDGRNTPCGTPAVGVRGRRLVSPSGQCRQDAQGHSVDRRRSVAMAPCHSGLDRQNA
jgi:hypothetical protein